ncbi:MAG: CtsR family transcriptional regulator [Clostridiaceae bacterium]|nr:CtsR family transcriptional regulator [Clostridiaceae bacterium]
MNLSKEIADIIMKMLDDGDSTAEIRRNDLAAQIGCVPSQINYVISSRFTPERGYIVESQRGGGGYIRISRVHYDPSTLKMHLINSVGEQISEKSCRANVLNLYNNGLLSREQARLIVTATSDANYKGLPEEIRDNFRAQLFKQLLLTTMN